MKTKVVHQRDVGFRTSYDNGDPKFYYNFMLYNISCLDIW